MNTNITEIRSARILILYDLIIIAIDLFDKFNSQHSTMSEMLFFNNSTENLHFQFILTKPTILIYFSFYMVVEKNIIILIGFSFSIKEIGLENPLKNCHRQCIVQWKNKCDKLR